MIRFQGYNVKERFAFLGKVRYYIGNRLFESLPDAEVLDKPEATSLEKIEGNGGRGLSSISNLYLEILKGAR
jgi:hypothetical protein